MPKKIKLVVDHSERTHARVSPSKLAYFEGCPGYEAREFEDQSKMHPVTLEGIDGHEALDSGDWSKLSKNLRGLVEVCQEYVDGLTSEFEFPLSHKENKLHCDGEVYGFCDLVITGDNEAGGIQLTNHAHVIDYKFGWLPVADAEVNLQGMAYVAGAFAKWPHLDKATMHFLQPRLGVISTAQFTRDGVEEILVKIRGIVERVQEYDDTQDEALLHAAPKNCLYCARKVRCPAFMSFLNLGVRPGLLPPMGEMDDPEYLSKVMDAVPALEAFVREVKESAISLRVEDGGEIPNYKLSVRRGRPVFSDSKDTYEAVKDLLDLDEFLECVTVSLPKMHKVIGAMAKRGEKGKAREVFEGTLEKSGVLTYGDSVTSLRREN